MWDGPSQPVEFRHDQGVAGAHGDEGLVEAGSGAGGAGEAVIGVDAILDDAKLQERLALGGQILPDRHLLEYLSKPVQQRPGATARPATLFLTRPPHHPTAWRSRYRPVAECLLPQAPC